MGSSSRDNMYALRLISFSISFLLSVHFGEPYTWYTGEQRLTEFQSQYASSKADIFFLMDNSGSLWFNGQNGFADEKTFITSLLSKIKIAKPATRVAVIRFGDHATIDINYISNLNGLNNKCEFKKRFTDIGYTGVMTNMNDGFAKVEEILFGAQSTNVRPWRVINPQGVYVNKVVFLLTDGEYNNGGNPMTRINNIKGNHVELFAVGVSGADTTFLRSVATSSDHYFYYNSFQSFRELATHIRGDPYQPDYDAEHVPKGRCRYPCDTHASCGCGLLSGAYICICHAGYYGTGEEGQCKPCGHGTYKKYPGLAQKSCTKCPANSGHNKLGSTTIQHCKCLKGYEGSPASGSACTIKKCSSFVPENGYTNPTNCNSVYDSTCTFNCRYGFQLIGDKTRRCTVRDDNEGRAYWLPSDTTPVCQRILCEQSRVPNAASEYGKCNTTDLRVNTNCTYTCSRGYRLVGSGVKICRVEKTWSGEDTACEVVTCPPLNSVDLTTLNNHDCTSKRLPFDSACRFDCPGGYSFNATGAQSATRYCEVTGTWDGQYQVCKDIKPPSFTNCPSNRIFTYNATFRTNTARVTWEIPEYEDNSILHDVNHKVTLVEKNGYKSPREFAIGTHRIEYTVTDKEGLKAHCEFVIKVQDKEAPFFTSCPQRIEKDFEGEPTNVLVMRVTWDEPVFHDNSGQDPLVVPDYSNGAHFKQGSYLVTYTATDTHGNKNVSCQFEINLKLPTCTLHPRPKNGALSCLTAFQAYQCAPLCKDGYDFAYKPKMLYYCANKKWMTWPPIPPNEPNVWPDCARRDDPETGTLKMSSSYYFKGDCNDNEVQETLKERFITVVSDGDNFPEFFCKFNKDCKVANIKVFCGDVDASRRRRRRRRSIEMEFRIQADFTVTPRNPITSQSDFQNLKSEMNQAYYGEVKNNVQRVNWKNEMKMDLVTSPNVLPPEPYCSAKRGSVIGRCNNIKRNCQGSQSSISVDSECFCNYDTGNIEKCIECPVGKYYDIVDAKCKLCPSGTYQDVEGQFGCKKCQPGFFTFGNDEKNFTACKEICKPGYFSFTGIGPCRPCGLGNYSTDYWSTSCTRCPAGTTTVLPAASKVEECGMKCAPGTYSSSGVEPCKPCEKGSYQPDEGKLSCLPCTGRKSTYGRKARSDAYCLVIDNCASNPCNNGGHCFNVKDDYECVCRDGFTGKNCQDEVSQCLSNPCYDNAQCIDKINGYKCLCARGFGGVHCDEPLPQCRSSPCRNHGQCIEASGTFECKCQNGWTGRFCEVNRDDCSKQPCKNNGICRDKLDGFTCECVAGYMGDNCEVDIDECASDPCGQHGRCEDKLNGYICHCSPGWTGNICQTKVTSCSNSPCQRGNCVERDRDFECQCPPNYAGKSCETEYSSDYDVAFTTSQIRTFSKRALYEDLHAFTVAFWMRTRDDENAGTPISYAVSKDQYIQENGLVLKDYGNLAIQINNQTGYTGDRLNDGHWHHVAITWQSSNGIWVYYRDGKEVKRATDPVARGDYIRGGGHFVLAQEQDWEAEEGQFTYNPYEAFVGDMSQMTVWNGVLTSRDIYNLAGSCLNSKNEKIVVSWADFVPGLTGSYRKTTVSTACKFNHALRGYSTVYNAILPSNNHETVHGVDLAGCAARCNAVRPGFHCRSFEHHSASQKCYLSKANRQTVAVSHPDNSGHDYYELNCIDMLGVESRVIADSQMSASSQRSSLSAAKHGRANARKVSGVKGMPDSDGGWIPSASNHGQYLQIDLGAKVKVTAVETQGADGYDYWVKSYRVQTSETGSTWSTLSETFTGNSDNKGRKKNQINAEARYIRFKPISWNNYIGMRVEIYGCSLKPEGVPSDLSSIAASYSGSCSQNPCHNAGTCISVPYGYVCKCPAGYTGDRCQKEMGCNQPSTPANGHGRWTQTTAGSTVHYSCNPGYQLLGSVTITCSKGKWSGTVPQCENINECARGTSGCNHHCTDFPGTFKCSCVAGYRLGHNQRTCTDINECAENVCSHGCINRQGSFQCTCPSGMVLSKSGTRCEDSDECASNNGGCAHLCLNTYLGSQCYCKHGYELRNGVSCEEIKCSGLNHPTHGKSSMNGDSVLGNTVSFSCNDGYKLVGSDERTCMADREWSGVQPVCKPVKCVDVGSIDHANRQMTGSGHDYKNRVTFKCHTSYRILGTAERTCDKTSNWSGEQPICIPNHCPTLQAPTHGRINGFRAELGATVGIACDIGYAIKGTSFRTCQQSKQWSGSHPTCELVDCGDPGVPKNGYRHGNYYKYNATINFSCKEKHHLEGAREIKCEANGKWSAPAPECLARSCGNPGVPYNGFKHGNAHTYGKNVTYSCQQGYTLVGNRKRTCLQSTAKWTGSLPSCNLVNCGEIQAPANGFRVGSEFTYKKVLAFDCNPGFKLVGARYRKCQENGLWSESSPTCIATSCGSFKHGPSGEIKSPNFPSQYDNDLYCTWKITVPTGKKVRIDFSEFKTEAGKDILYVFDTDKAEPILEYSGVGFKPRPVVSSGKSLRVRFVSNGAAASNGFRLTYSQVDCGGMLETPTGVITSPGFKGQYPSNLHCIWLIHMPKKQVQLSFTDFNTQQSYDRVEIFRGPKSTDRRDVNLSGLLLPDGFFVTHEYMYIRFTTSPQNDRRYNGFKAKYEEYMY